ncbi:hypothetical protein [uncultured Roseovarius sp.]|uniref:hypothetical protein n=1 Tax=Roseovarius sp. TaxID=1486281 RepID=UPI0025D89C82|nr:hypothetical protein [uncultured Roseovarius sp.]
MSYKPIIGLVARAGRAFMAAKGKDPEIEGKPLAEFLLSDEHIGPYERELLAELVTGEWRRPKGRPKGVGPGHIYAVLLVSDYRRRVSEYGPNGEEAAAQDTAIKFGVSTRTVRSYVREARKREAAIKTEIATK